MGYYEDNNSFITGNTSEKTAKFLKDIFGKETTPVSDCDPFENCTTLIDGFISGLCIDDLDEVDVTLYDATWLLFPETQMVFCHVEKESGVDWNLLFQRYIRQKQKPTYPRCIRNI